jgi:hypothetical protein
MTLLKLLRTADVQCAVSGLLVSSDIQKTPFHRANSSLEDALLVHKMPAGVSTYDVRMDVYRANHGEADRSASSAK